MLDGRQDRKRLQQHISDHQLIDGLRAENAELREERNRLRAALKAVPVIRIVAHGEPYCPWCGFMEVVDMGAGYHIARHAANCQR